MAQQGSPTDHKPKILVIYYSFEGSTRLIAETLAAFTGADLLPLVPRKEMTSRGFSKYFWSGSQVMMKRKPVLTDFDLRPEDYELIFIGTPVWAWTFAPPVGTLLGSTDLSGKKVALFCSHGGQKGKALVHMQEQLPQSQVLGMIDFFEPVNRDTETSIKRAEEWAQEMVSLAGGV